MLINSNVVLKVMAILETYNTDPETRWKRLKDSINELAHDYGGEPEDSVSLAAPAAEGSTPKSTTFTKTDKRNEKTR